MWRGAGGYIVVGLLQAALALLIFIRADAWELRSATHSDGAARKLEKISYRATLRRPIVWVNIVIFFLYSGTEITAGNWMYTIFTESRGVAVTTAGFWVSVYWASFTAGRIVFGFVANRFNPIHATRAMIAVGALAATLIWWNPADLVSFLALALMGFAMSPIFPLLMSTTPCPVGRGRRDQRHRLPGGGRVDWHRRAAGAGGRTGRTRQPGGDPALYPGGNHPDVRAARSGGAQAQVMNGRLRD
jgi:fucose permease